MKKKVLVTGGTGSLGSAICERKYDEWDITIISRDDHKQVALRNRLPGIDSYSLDLGNPLHYPKLIEICHDKDFCIHAAAQKQVGESQYQPPAYVSTNIWGSYHLLQAWASIHGNCRNLLAVGTDKAVASLNFYGASKKVMAGLVRQYDGSVLRYGNVITSQGAFIHFWREQVEAGKPIEVRVGNPSGDTPTRFLLPMDKALDLVEDALSLMDSGLQGIFLPRYLQAFDLMDVAQATGADIKVTEMAGYEKLHERLLAEGEKIGDGSYLLGRVEVPWWPEPDYYEPFCSNTADRLTGKQVLAAAGWDL
jgi:UDP-N-acetylglucosamine 4,6-dehydratase